MTVRPVGRVGLVRHFGRVGLIIAVTLPLLILGQWAAQLKPPSARRGAGLTSGAGGAALDIPAPPSSERLFGPSSAGAEANFGGPFDVAQGRPEHGRMGGAPGQMLRYRSSADSAAVVSYYREQMPRRGWTALERESAAYTGKYPGQILVFRKGRAACLIAVSESETEGGIMVTVLWRAAPQAK